LHRHGYSARRGAWHVLFNGGGVVAVCAAEVAKKTRKIGELYVKAKGGTSREKVFGDVFLARFVFVFVSCL
jgi:hypothetical protein